MAQLVTIFLTTGNEPLASIKSIFNKQTSNQRQQAEEVVNYFNGAAMGVRKCSMDIQVNGGASVAASGTITLSGVSTVGDTILINGSTLTAVASGAVGLQWNVKASASLQAAEIARAIIASATPIVSGIVTSTAVGAVVTVASLSKGLSGNAVTLAKGTDAGSVMTVSGAGRLLGGVAVTPNLYRFGL